MAKGQLRVRIVGDDSDLKGKLKSAGGAVAAFAAATAAAAIAVGAGLVKIGSEFDSAFDTIRIGTGATGDALAALKDDFRQVVKDVPTDFASAATAIADLNTRTGQTGKPLQELSKQFLELSRLTGTDLSTNIAGITRLFGDWSISTDEQSATMDKLFRASQSTGIGVDRLSELMVQFGSPMRQLGIDFDFATAMFARFEKEGVNIETLMPGLRMALKNFAKDGREPAAALLESMQAIKAAGSAAEANQLAFEVFGVRAGPDMAAAIREGRFDLDEMIDTITNGSDTILQAAADTESFGQKWQKLKNRVFLALEPIAMRLFDALGTGLDRVIPMFESFVAGIQSGTGVGGQFRTVVEAVVGAATMFWGALQQIGLALAPLLPPLMSLGQQILAVVWPALQAIGNTIITQVVPAFSAFMTAAQPVLTWLIETLGGALIGALQGAVKVIQGVLDVITGVFKVFAGVFTGDWSKAWEGVKQIVSGVWQVIKGAFQVWWNVGILRIARVAFNLVKGLFKAGWNAVKGLVSRAWSAMVGTVRSGVGSVVSWVRNLKTSIVNVFSNAMSWLKNAGLRIIRGLWNGIRERWNTARDFFRNLKDRIKGFFSGAARWLWNAGKDIINGLWKGIQSGFGKIKDGLGWLTDSITGWKGPASVDKVLLRPTGQLIVQGLIDGMNSKIPDVQRTLGGITDMIGGTRPKPSQLDARMRDYASRLLKHIQGGGKFFEDFTAKGVGFTGTDRLNEQLAALFFGANPGFDFGPSGTGKAVQKFLEDLLRGDGGASGWVGGSRTSAAPLFASSASASASRPMDVRVTIETRPGAESSFANWLMGQMRKGDVRFVDSRGLPVRVG